jgi:HlyD family secretion protein
VVQGVVTYKAVLAIQNSDLLIRPGMTATAQVVVEELKDVLMVPNAALRFSPAAEQPTGGGFLKALLPSVPSATRRPPSKQEESGRNLRVWLLRDGIPTAVPVTIGSTDGRMTQIVRGEISPGQAIVVDAATRKR